MRQALERADRMLAVYTPAYFAAPYAERELHAALRRHRGRIVPVLVEPCEVPELFRPLLHIDLVGLEEPAAAGRLRDRLAGGRPTTKPPLPHPPSAGKPAWAPTRTRWWCRRWPGWVGLARPSWPPSTPTGSPPTTS